jgi:hypothetical protein
MEMKVKQWRDGVMNWARLTTFTVLQALAYILQFEYAWLPALAIVAILLDGSDQIRIELP